MAHSERVPRSLQERFEKLCEATDAFSDAHLDAEYRQMIRHLLAALCRKRPSPVAGGKVNTWAAAAVHAIGSANFLFDSTQTPHCRSQEIFAFFGVSASNAQARSKQVRDLMEVVDGFLHDARRLPLQLQRIAYEKGLIPSIPALKESGSPGEDTRSEPASAQPRAAAPPPAEHRRQEPRRQPAPKAPEPDNGQLGLF